MKVVGQKMLTIETNYMNFNELNFHNKLTYNRVKKNEFFFTNNKNLFFLVNFFLFQ